MGGISIGGTLNTAYIYKYKKIKTPGTLWITRLVWQYVFIVRYQCLIAPNRRILTLQKGGQFVFAVLVEYPRGTS